MADSDGLWALAALGLALVAARGATGADTMPVSTALAQQAGQHVTMNATYVASVPADEGFWVNSDHGRIWVQIATFHESPYDVDAGDTVSFSGDVVRHDGTFPAQVGVTSAEGAADLSTAGAHITIPVNALAFNDSA
jgi:uncharacterized protein YdeI (BOF family)